MPLELGDAGLGHAHAPLAFERERLGDDRHGENAELLGHARDHRGRARAGAAAHARRDEHHVGAGQRGANLLERLLRSSLADFGLGAGADAFREARTELDAMFRARDGQRLGVRVGDDELGAGETGGQHVVDGVAAAAADADDDDARLQVRILRRLHLRIHDWSSEAFPQPLSDALQIAGLLGVRRSPAPCAFQRWGRTRSG